MRKKSSVPIKLMLMMAIVVVEPHQVMKSKSIRLFHYIIQHWQPSSSLGEGGKLEESFRISLVVNDFSYMHTLPPPLSGK